MFGVGTFHGDLHPGNCIIDRDGNFVFIDNGAICDAPKNISLSLFNFFENLSNNDKDDAFEALLNLADSRPPEKKVNKFKENMKSIYDGFEDKITPIIRQSEPFFLFSVALTQGLLQTHYPQV